MRRGQVAIELVAACALLLLAAFMCTFSASQWEKSSSAQAAGLHAQSVLSEVFSQILLAKSAGDGYSSCSDFPAALAGGSAYVLSADAASSSLAVSVGSDGTQISTVLPPRTLSSGVNFSGGSLCVSNSGGLVVLS